MQILLVEDDDTIAEPLARGLVREGIEVIRVSRGRDALGVESPDLVLLDLGLPDMDGYAVCRALRSISDVPIIILTARGEEMDRVMGLELGADDYVVKPFGFRELIARIHAVTRRGVRHGATSTDDQAQDANDPDLHVHGPLELDTRAHRVRMDGTELTLTRKEFDLLALLMSDPGAIRTRDEIIEQVWDAHWYGPTKTLDVHIASLRKKLGDPTIITTVRGVGFRMRDED